MKTYQAANKIAPIAFTWLLIAVPMAAATYIYTQPPNGICDSNGCAFGNVSWNATSVFSDYLNTLNVTISHKLTVVEPSTGESFVVNPIDDTVNVSRAILINPNCKGLSQFFAYDGVVGGIASTYWGTCYSGVHSDLYKDSATVRSEAQVTGGLKLMTGMPATGQPSSVGIGAGDNISIWANDSTVVIQRPNYTSTVTPNDAWFILRNRTDDSNLHVGIIPASSSLAWRISASYSSTGHYYPIDFYTSDTFRLRIHINGSVEIADLGGRLCVYPNKTVYVC